MYVYLLINFKCSLVFCNIVLKREYVLTHTQRYTSMFVCKIEKETKQSRSVLAKCKGMKSA